MPDTTSFPLSVIGGGLIGLITALSGAAHCSRFGGKLALIAPPSLPDGRTTAILSGGINFLDRLGVWSQCSSNSASIETLRIIDGTQRLFRPPQTDFHSFEIGLDSFGNNIRNDILLDVLIKMVHSHPCIKLYPTTLKSLDLTATSPRLHLASGETISASLVAACDGKDSLVRKECGITSNSWAYPQHALVMNFSHTLPHENVSMEIHTNTGPLTQVPLSPSPNDTSGSSNFSSLIWVLPPDLASSHLASPKTKLALEIEKKMQSCLGKITLDDIQSFPLSGMKVEKYAHNQCILLGESAHLFPPIGAQGFNLGLRDIEVFHELLTRHPTDTTTLPAAYHAHRHKDIALSTKAVDLLNRSLLADFLPVQIFRTLSLSLLHKSGWLRRQLMSRILSPPLSFKD